MSRKHLKPRDKVTQRMTRDGVVLENQTTGEEINISDREAEQDFTPAGATGRAEKVLERADQARERHSSKKAARQAEIGSLVGMSRSAVQRHRKKTLDELRNKLTALMPKGG